MKGQRGAATGLHSSSMTWLMCNWDCRFVEFKVKRVEVVLQLCSRNGSWGYVSPVPYTVPPGKSGVDSHLTGQSLHQVIKP